MSKPNGYIPTYGDEVPSLPFSLPLLNNYQLVTTYVTAGTAGQIVYVNPIGQIQAAQLIVGRNPIAAIQFLASGTTQWGNTVTSTAAGLFWEASPPLGGGNE